MSEKVKILPVDIVDEMKTAYIDYSMSVIVGRSLPDVRDGFKPVHRRILYAMNELGTRSSGAYKKSARIVGEVLGKYHPHGDSAVYEAMVRLAQPWSMRGPLIDGQGNYGSPDGDGPAAMRYTEARLTKLAEAMLEDIDKETVLFQQNFDDSLEEPTVLPTRVPQLLLNGASGIAVGMATNLLPHNLSEIIDGCIAYIDNHDITVDEIIAFVKAPDFPTGGIIYGVEGVYKAFRTGRGSVVVRGKVEIEDGGGSARSAIIIRELPYQVDRDALVEKISDLVNNKVIEGIADVANQSNKEGTRIVVELKRDVVPDVVLNLLYKYTSLQMSFGVNNIVIVGGRPRLLNLKELIAHFVDFRHEIVVKRTEFEHKEAEKKALLLAGYLVALDNLDEFVTIIRESESAEQARRILTEKFHLSDTQTKAILDLRLHRLTGMERQKIRDDYAQTTAIIERCKQVLESRQLRLDIMKEEMRDIRQKFGTERKSEIDYNATSAKFDMRDIIANEEVVLTISHSGYMKRTVASEYRQQKRGGRGLKGSATNTDDWIEHAFVVSTHHTLLIFTQKGKCFWLKVYEMPETARGTRGRAMQNLLRIEPDDSIRTIIDVPNIHDRAFLDKHCLMFCTKRGIVKKTKLSKFARPLTSGINAINILQGDQLLHVCMTDDKCQMIMATKKGFALRFDAEKIRPTGRGATGVKGINLSKDDEIAGMVCVRENEKKHVLVVSAQGYGKRTPVDEYRLTNRGGKGVKTMNITPKTGNLIGIVDVQDGEDLMVICRSGMMIRMAVSDVRITGRNSQGVILIRLPKSKDADTADSPANAHIVALTKIGADLLEQPASSTSVSV